MWTKKRIDVGACEVGYDPSGCPAVSWKTKMKMPCGDENGLWRGLIAVRVNLRTVKVAISWINPGKCSKELTGRMWVQDRSKLEPENNVSLSHGV